MIKRSLLPLLLVWLILNVQGCQKPLPADAPDIMYFILIDRFADGDPNNNSGGIAASYEAYDGSHQSALSHYQGGDLRGIIQKLDYLHDMGINMLWISPFLDNSNTDYVGWWPYHGYHPIDFYAVDEHFGTLADLQELVNSAHARGLKIIFDMPFNQTAQDHPWLEDPTRRDWFHLDEQGEPWEITDWFDQQQIERGELHGLPDLAQENPEVRDYLLAVSKYWIEQTGCDGFRLDAVKHIPLAFWQDYNREIREFAGADFLLLGEVFWGEAQRIASYKDVGFDLLFDIPGYYAIRNTFCRGSSMKEFSAFFWNTERLLSPKPLATLIDNHDVARFNVGLGADAWQKQLLALGWLMTRPGMPVIYYGTELGMKGYPVLGPTGQPQDYLNRLPFPRTFTDQDSLRIQEFTELTQLRRAHPASYAGAFFEVYKDWSSYAFLRVLPAEQLLVVINNAGSEEFLQIPIPTGSDPGGLKRVYGSAVIREESGGWWARLPANSLSVWTIDGIRTQVLPQEVAFTDRLAGDYQLVRLFALDPLDTLRSLQLAGDFNNWQATDYNSFRKGDTLFVTIPLKPGEYQYKFVLNGSRWESNPQAVDSVADPYGGQNSLLRVSNPD